MKIQYTYDKEKQAGTIEIEGSTVSDALAKLDINPVTVIVSRDNNIVLTDAKLNDGDSIKIMSVISGG